MIFLLLLNKYKCMLKKIIISFTVATFSISAFGQDLKAMQEQFLEAEYFFMSGSYNDALPIYLSLFDQMQDNANLAYRIGVCYLNINGKKNMSVPYLEKAVLQTSSRHKEGTILHVTAPYDAYFQLGNAYRVNYKFDRAREAYLKYRETLLSNDRENLDFIDHLINTCDNAKKMIAHPVNHRIEPSGIPMDDNKENFNPVISADGKTFIFMTTLPFYNAVMCSINKNGVWSEPENITPYLKPEGQIFVSSLSADGKRLLFSRNDLFNSDIFMSVFNGKTWSEPVKLNKNINTKYWESQAYITDDEKSIVFSSDRPGGFGGLDIYISYKEKNDWGPAANIGPIINTPFNEDRPTLINGGQTLFFSSQGHENMGGYDIFMTTKNPNGTWNTPENIGYPLNTPDDNIFFTPSEKDNSLYMSILREAEGKSKEAIYHIILNPK